MSRLRTVDFIPNTVEDRVKFQLGEMNDLIYIFKWYLASADLMACKRGFKD